MCIVCVCRHATCNFQTHIHADLGNKRNVMMINTINVVGVIHRQCHIVDLFVMST